jgi:hypothetical protein
VKSCLIALFIFFFACGPVSHGQQGSNFRSLCEVGISADKRGGYRVLSSKAICSADHCMGGEYVGSSGENRIKFFSTASLVVGREYYLFLSKTPATGILLDVGGDVIESARAVKINTVAKFFVPVDGAYWMQRDGAIVRDVPGLCLGRAAECGVVDKLRSKDGLGIYGAAIEVRDFNAKLNSCLKKKIDDLNEYGE